MIARATLIIIIPILLLILATPLPAPAQSPETDVTPIEHWKDDWLVGNKDAAYATRQGEIIRIGNAHLERVYRLAHESLGTAQFVNKITHRNPGSQIANEFGLQLSNPHAELTAADFRLTGISSKSAEASLLVLFHLQHRTTPALTVTLALETYPERKYQRKWLTVTWSGDGDRIVDQIDVERSGGLGWWYIGQPTHQGTGQPLFVADLYMGLEHVAGEVTANYIRHFPGRSARGGLTSKSAIWGVAKSAGDLKRAFFEDYLYTLPTVRHAEPFVIWNMIGVGFPEEKLYLQAADSIAASAKKAGFHIDSFAMDDPWVDHATVWQPDPLRFPKGLDPFAQKVQALGSHLGLWASVMGLGLDTHWGAAMDLEVTTVADRNLGGRYCMAGPHYKAKIIQIFTDYVRNQKVNYFKFDYNTFDCDVPTHGHPIGAAGHEAQIDAFIDILKSIKSADPNCRIGLTTGMWLSPWWVPYADYVWLGGSDIESAKLRNLTPQDANTSGRDIVMYDDFVTKNYVFPQVNLMTHGFWQSSSASYAKWQDDVVMTLARGISKWEILNSPSTMDEKRWAFLGRALSWARSNWDVLQNTEMILGDPGKGEVYGYSHIGKQAALIIVRNPDEQSKLVSLTMGNIKLNEDDELSHGGALTACELYPAFRELDWHNSPAGPINVQVLGSETKIIAITADAALMARLKL